MKVTELAGIILDRLLPRHCLLCGQFSADSNACRPCTAGLPRNELSCSRCSLPVASVHDQTCGPCLLKPPPWQHAIAGLVYGFPVDQLVCRFKFGHNLACGEVLASELLRQVRNKAATNPDFLVPVPLHKSRHFYRNFNQADLLARALGKSLGIPVNARLLRRVRRTRAQSGLDARHRRQNLAGAFSFNKKSPELPDNCHVALIDDVCTTGETLAACTGVLMKAGVKEVSIWVAARAPPP